MSDHWSLPGMHIDLNKNMVVTCQFTPKKMFTVSKIAALVLTYSSYKANMEKKQTVKNTTIHIQKSTPCHASFF